MSTVIVDDFRCALSGFQIDFDFAATVTESAITYNYSYHKHYTASRRSFTAIDLDPSTDFWHGDEFAVGFNSGHGSFFHLPTYWPFDPVLFRKLGSGQDYGLQINDFSGPFLPPGIYHLLTQNVVGFALGGDLHVISDGHSDGDAHREEDYPMLLNVLGEFIPDRSTWSWSLSTFDWGNPPSYAYHGPDISAGQSVPIDRLTMNDMSASVGPHLTVTAIY